MVATRTTHQTRTVTGESSLGATACGGVGDRSCGVRRTSLVLCQSEKNARDSTATEGTEQGGKGASGFVASGEGAVIIRISHKVNVLFLVMALR